MKKTTIKKLELKKGVIAQLNKTEMNGAAGGIITEFPTHPCESIAVNLCGKIDRLPTRHYECSNTCP